MNIYLCLIPKLYFSHLLGGLVPLYMTVFDFRKKNGQIYTVTGSYGIKRPLLRGKFLLPRNFKPLFLNCHVEWPSP